MSILFRLSYFSFFACATIVITIAGAAAANPPTRYIHLDGFYYPIIFGIYIKKPFIDIRNYLNSTRRNQCRAKLKRFEIECWTPNEMKPFRFLCFRKMCRFPSPTALWETRRPGMYVCIDRIKFRLRPAATSTLSSSVSRYFFLFVLSSVFRFIAFILFIEQMNERTTNKWQPIYFQVPKIDIKINLNMIATLR